MPDYSQDVRKKAEICFHEDKQSIDCLQKLSQYESAKLIEELRIHQIELEMQNDELISTQLQLQQSKQNYYDLFQYAPLGYAVIDQVGLIQQANLCLQKMLLADRTQLFNKPFASLIHPEDQGIFLSRLRSLSKKAESKEIELRWLSFDNKICWVQLKSTIYIEKSSKTLPEQKQLILLTVSDISTRKETERALIKAREEAEQVAKEKSNFMAKMSHEIRTPLHGILGMAQLIQPTLKEKNQQHQINNIISSGKNLSRIVDDILDLSKLNANQLDLHKEPFLLSETLAYLRENFQIQAQTKGLLFNIRCDELLLDKKSAKRLIGDSHRLLQVLINLLSNAVKFTDKGSIGLHIKILRNSEFQLHLSFSVFDTGIGIDSLFQKKLFEPFTQADSSISRKYGGTGLGLVICQQILQLMGSDLHFNSTIEKGSNFYFDLKFPIAEPKNHFAENKSFTLDKTLAVGNNTKSIDKNSKHILLVDDNPINLEISKEMLLSLGYTFIDMANDGQEALDQFINSEPEYYDLILMDCEMPIMDGCQSSQQIRKYEQQKQLKPIIIIALSAHALEEKIDIALQSGMDDFLSKPVFLDGLDKTLMLNFNRLSGNKKAKNKRSPIKRQAAISTTQTTIKPQQLEQHIWNELVLMDKKSETDFLHKILSSYVQQSKILYQQLLTASEKKQTETIRIVAHNFASGSKQIGAESIAKLCSQIEINHTDNHTVSSLIKKLQPQWLELKNSLELLLRDEELETKD